MLNVPRKAKQKISHQIKERERRHESFRPNENKEKSGGKTRTLTLKFLGSLNTVLSVSAWRSISTSISWASSGSEDSMSERAAFNAALEAWSAGAGSELWTEEDIKIIRNDFFQECAENSDGMGGGPKRGEWQRKS